MDFVFLFVGILASALCEYLASSLLGLRQSVLSTMADEGSPIGKRFKAAYDDTTEIAFSISVVDTLAITVTVFAVASMAWGDVGSTLVRLIAVLIVLGTAKVIAAVLGARFSEHALQFTSYVLVGIRSIALPPLLVFRFLMSLTKRRTDEEEAREELEALVETAREEGALDPGEYRIMTNIMRLSSLNVSDVMSPRPVVFGLPSLTTVADALKLPEMQMFSRFPVYDASDLDSVGGYVIAKDVLRAALAGRQNVELAKLKRDVSFIPENVSLERALEQFLAQRSHIFMVVDEHGGVEGIITLEDILETMLGAEIVDEADHVVDLRALAKQRRDARIARLSAQRAPGATPTQEF